MSLADDSQSESIARHTFSVIVRIIDETTQYELDFDLITSVTSFVYRLIHDGNFTYSRILRLDFKYSEIEEMFSLFSELVYWIVSKILSIFRLYWELIFANQES